ncbi:hypothetical protein EVAR_42479_1 [Eumeta japonica]|uniref:C2H2-type domain-containing protein n=1 Tax=Eumeta variegata TaxID=151549 RepID=A0A4C1XYK9_EUMVA|nr:hypothetical protein EVAR_42479_1 [Eumeta japonica]
MSAKREKKLPKTYNIPPKEMIVTRNKSAQMRRQQGSKSVSSVKKSFGIKASSQRKEKKEARKRKSENEKEDRVETIEYCPEKLKRCTITNKIVLKPKYELKTVITLDEFKKRKPVSPKKQEQLVDFVEDLSINDVSEIEHELETVTPPNEDESEDSVSADKLKNFNMSEIIILEDESEDLTEEDLMEIITCPSPVWWEDPPNDSYIEDPIDVLCGSTASVTENKTQNLDIASIATTSPKSNDDPTPTRTTPESNTADSISQAEGTGLDIYGCSLKRDHTFLKKRSALENLLSSLKGTVSVNVENGVDKEKRPDVKSRTINKTRKAIPSKKANPTEVLPRVPIEVLNDLENFEIPTAKSAKRNVFGECIVIDDDADDVDVKSSMDRQKKVDLDVKIDDAPQSNETVAEPKDKISVTTQNVAENKSIDEKAESTEPIAEKVEMNGDVDAKNKCVGSAMENFKAKAHISGKNDDVDKNNGSLDINEKSKATKATPSAIQKNVNCKIFIKKNATLKPKTILGIPHSIVGNMVIPHSKNLDTSAKPFILPLKRVFINNINQNCPTSVADAPPKIVAGVCSEVKSTIHNSVNKSKPVNSGVDIAIEKDKNGKSDNGSAQQVTGTSGETKDSTADGHLKKPIKDAHRPREITCDLHAEIQIVGSDDFEISASETSQMIKEAYIKFLTQEKTMKFEKGMLIRNNEHAAGTSLPPPNCQQFASDDSNNREAPKNVGGNISRPSFRAVPVTSVARINTGLLLNRNKMVKDENSDPPSVPIAMTKNAKISAVGSACGQGSVTLKAILDAKLKGLKREESESSNRKRPHPESVKPDALTADAHKAKVDEKGDDAQRPVQNDEASKIRALIDRLKRSSAKRLTECENCNVRSKSIAISKMDVVKYCYKCSSIFNTTNCDYCSKEGDSFKIGKPCSCRHCHYLCCCVQNLEKHMKLHDDKQNSETPG